MRLVDVVAPPELRQQPRAARRARPAGHGADDPPAPADGQEPARRPAPADGQEPARQVPAWLLDETRLHVATEWDKFHRADLALTRAVNSCPLAEEVFAIGTMVDHWFNLGEGRLLFRSAAGAIGMDDPRSGRLPGLTRKVGALAEEPGHFLHNFPAYVAGVHAKMAYKRAGHSQQTSLAAMHEGGRRMTSLDFITFTIAFRDIMKGIVAPWSLQIQQASLEPWALSHIRKLHRAKENHALLALSALREFVRVVTLLRQHVPTGNLRIFVRAWSYGSASKMFLSYSTAGSGATEPLPPWGRLFPVLMAALGNLLLPERRADGVVGPGQHPSVPKFRGVDLHAAQQTPDAEGDTMLLGPHCQCAFLASRRQSTKPTRVFWKTVQRGGVSKRLYLPAWVVNSPAGSVAPRPRADGQEPDDAGLRAAPLRFHRRPVNAPPPLGVDQKDRFRDRIRANVSRCRLPGWVPAVFGDIDSALAGAASFLRKMIEEEDKLLGSEGCNAGHARAVRAASQCFDFFRLLRNTPTQGDVTEFGVLARMLLPYLRLTEWPSRQAHPQLDHRWPSEQALQYQYVGLMNRLRLARWRLPSVWRQWWRPRAVRVQALTCYDSVLWLTNKLLPQAPLGHTALARALVCKIAACISAMLGRGLRRWDRTRDNDDDDYAGSAAASRPGPFEVSLQYVMRCGFPSAGRKRPHALRRRIRHMWSYTPSAPVPGNVAQIVLPGSIGKLVYVSDVIEDLDWSGVSAAIDGHPYFSSGGRWHAARIHHWCRTMSAPEAVCEQIGSMMRALYDANRNVDIGALMDSVALQGGGVTCCGSPRDEMICKEVTDVLAHLGRDAHIGAQAKRRRADAGVDATTSSAVQNFREDEDARLRESGRLHYFRESSSESSDVDAQEACPQWGEFATCASSVATAVKARRAESAPAMQIPAVAHILERPDTLARLPIHQEDIRTSVKPRADSVVKSSLKQWLLSEEGRQWTAVKRKRFEDASEPGASSASVQQTSSSSGIVR